MGNEKDKFSLTELEQFCLDAYLLNGQDDRAYLLSRKRGETKATEENLHRIALRWLRSPHVKAYLDDRRAVLFQQIKKTADFEEDGVKELVEQYKDKDFIIAELVKTQAGLQGKEKAEILNKIADLQQMKKEEVKKEEQRVHFYLPLPYCKNCPNRFHLGEK